MTPELRNARGALVAAIFDENCRQKSFDVLIDELIDAASNGYKAAWENIVHLKQSQETANRDRAEAALRKLREGNEEMARFIYGE